MDECLQCQGSTPAALIFPIAEPLDTLEQIPRMRLCSASRSTRKSPTRERNVCTSGLRSTCMHPASSNFGCFLKRGRCGVRRGC